MVFRYRCVTGQECPGQVSLVVRVMMSDEVWWLVWGNNAHNTRIVRVCNISHCIQYPARHPRGHRQARGTHLKRMGNAMYVPIKSRYFFHSYFSSLFSDFPWVEHNFLNYDFSASLPPVRNAGCVILTMGHNGQWGYFGPNKPRHPGRNVVQYPHMYTVQYRPPVYMSLYTSGQSFPGPQPGRSSEPWVRILAAPCLEMSRMKTVRESDHQIERL